MHAVIVSAAPHTSALYPQSAQTHGELAQAQLVSLRTVCTAASHLSSQSRRELSSDIAGRPWWSLQRPETGKSKLECFWYMFFCGFVVNIYKLKDGQLLHKVLCGCVDVDELLA